MGIQSLCGLIGVGSLPGSFFLYKIISVKCFVV